MYVLCNDHHSPSPIQGTIHECVNQEMTITNKSTVAYILMKIVIGLRFMTLFEVFLFFTFRFFMNKAGTLCYRKSTHSYMSISFTAVSQWGSTIEKRKSCYRYSKPVEQRGQGGNQHLRFWWNEK